jgi:hypothetical protein
MMGMTLFSCIYYKIFPIQYMILSVNRHL